MQTVRDFISLDHYFVAILPEGPHQVIGNASRSYGASMTTSSEIKVNFQTPKFKGLHKKLLQGNLAPEEMRDYIEESQKSTFEVYPAEKLGRLFSQQHLAFSYFDSTVPTRDGVLHNVYSKNTFANFEDFLGFLLKINLTYQIN